MGSAIIVTGGIEDIHFIQDQINQLEYDLLIGVDGGLDYLYALNITPDLILGDFDSISKEAKAYFNTQNIKVIEYPSEKNYTDTHLALEVALEYNINQIYLLAATGTRLDHTLANIFILQEYIDRADCRVMNQHNVIQLIKGMKSLVIEKEDFKYISLLPITNKVDGITTKGFKYELRDSTLYRSQTRGVSNELKDERGRVTIKKGIMAIIKSRD